MLEGAFVQKVRLLGTKRNAYGDVVPDPSIKDVSLMCRFRVESTAVHMNNREELRSDQAMIWFAPTAPIEQNDIVLYEGRYWEIVRINEARRLGGIDIQFLKVWVNAHDMVS